jgi:hypothetical protein
VGRLAAELLAGIDAYRHFAREYVHDEDRLVRLRESMFGQLAERLSQDGYAGHSADVWAVLTIDVELNAQGLDVWLKRRQHLSTRGG